MLQFMLSHANTVSNLCPKPMLYWHSLMLAEREASIYRDHSSSSKLETLKLLLLLLLKFNDVYFQTPLVDVGHAELAPSGVPNFQSIHRKPVTKPIRLSTSRTAYICCLAFLPFR